MIYVPSEGRRARAADGEGEETRRAESGPVGPRSGDLEALRSAEGAKAAAREQSD